jgi:hypothetical protein
MGEETCEGGLHQTLEPTVAYRLRVVMHGCHAQEFQVHRILLPALRMKAQVAPTAEVGKILFVAKRKERLHIGECRGTRKPVIL